MKEEKFKIIQFIRELIVVVDKELENFPRKDLEIKNRIRNNTYDLLEIAYEANVTPDNNQKKKLLYKMITKIKTIDFLLDLSCDKKLISEKKYCKFGLKLDDVVKYTSGWLKTINGA